ncbi:claudin-4-like [Etheostoma cragini]|uniref:claudin-4-like n=1 Tax=Etheostoma cragini TaxID=417921 RepID=UPI00155DEC7A|nr:claudin-4-like [Etheostoma cragini]
MTGILWQGFKMAWLSRCPFFIFSASDEHKPLISTSYSLRGTLIEETMASMGMQMVGFAVALLGWIGVFAACVTPMWRVTAFIGSNLVTAQVTLEGIWMTCVVESTGHMQCDDYDSMLDLSSDMQAAQALMVVSVVTGVIGISIAFTGGKCTNFFPEERAKVTVSVTAGVILIISGIVCLIPISWTAHMVITDFYNPLLLDAQKRELGASLYIGWVGGVMVIFGGVLLCTTCPSEEVETPSVRFFLNKHGGNSREDSVRSFTPSKTYI